MRIELDVPVPMRDDVLLVCDVQLPAGDGPFPTLLQRVPYGRGHPMIRDGALDTVQAVRRGYAVVTQDCRGRFDSGGDFVPFVHEAVDGADTVEWIRRQTWSNGLVGMFGRSYSAFLQWQTAALQPEGLRAIAPMFSGADPWPDWFGAGDSLEWGFLCFWSLRQLAPESLQRIDREAAEAAARVVAGIDDVLEERVAGALNSDLTAITDVLPWLFNWVDDRRRNLSFEALSGHFATASAVGTPALVVAGWFDIFLTGTLRAAATNAAHRELLIGPWPHGGSNPGVFPEIQFGPAASGDAIGLTSRQLAWFDRWLGGSGESGPGVTWFQPSRGWLTADSWPPPAEQVVVSLDRLAGPLTYDEDAPVPTVGGATFLPGLEVAANAGPRDQQILLDRPDVRSWFGAPLVEPLDMAGPIQCDIVLDADLGIRVVVRVVERSASGRTMLVADGATTYDGSGIARVNIGPTAWHFGAGSRIGLLVSHTSSPRYRRWTTDIRPAESRRGSSEVRLGSVLHIPVLPLERACS